MAMNVAVVGVGPSGLNALRQLTAEPNKFQATAFEKSDVVGGTWVYTEKTGKDEFGLPVFPSMYKEMRTNVPKEVMAFLDYPFDKSLPSYMKHDDVRKYLESYASHFHLKEHIKFLTTVERVKPIFASDKIPSKWEITTKSTRQPELPAKSYEFDAVIVCNGHYSVPLLPNIKGKSSFQGDIIHSHDYRHHDVYKNKRVIVLGAGFSGIDIAMEVAKCAAKVILSHNKEPWTFALPPNVTQAPGIKELMTHSALLVDGTEEHADSIILCTGYERHLEFLSPECGINIQDGRVTPLFKHMIHTTYPTLTFVGLCDNVIFPFFYYQAIFVVKTLGGSFKLPPKEEMDLDTARDFEERLQSGMQPRHAHYMRNTMFKYMKELINMANLEPLPEAMLNLLKMVNDRINTSFNEYKNDNYEKTGENTYTLVPRKAIE